MARKIKVGDRVRVALGEDPLSALVKEVKGSQIKVLWDYQEQYPDYDHHRNGFLPAFFFEIITPKRRTRKGG